MSCIGTGIMHNLLHVSRLGFRPAVYSLGLHWRGALLPFMQGPSFNAASSPSPIFLCFLLFPFLAKHDSLEYSCCNSYPLATRLVSPIATHIG